MKLQKFFLKLSSDKKVEALASLILVPKYVTEIDAYEDYEKIMKA